MFQNNNILRIADKDKLHIDLHKGATKMLLNLLLRLIKQAINHKFKHPINPSIIKLLQNDPQLIQIKKSHKNIHKNIFCFRPHQFYSKIFNEQYNKGLITKEQLEKIQTQIQIQI